MNGYFQIASIDGKCVIELYPPSDGGENIRREEILEYLSVKNILYDIKLLGEALNNLSEPQKVYTNTPFITPDNEFVWINITPDNMLATARIAAPFLGGKQMPKNEFMRELTSRGIVYGVDEKSIDEMLNDRKYCTDFVVAKGLEPVQGKDASIEYFFNTDPKIRPTLNEDGSVDFFHLNTISCCKKGDLLARLTPAVNGQVGLNIKGERIRPREVKQAVLKFGHNITLSEDKTEITSDVSGHVSLSGGKVFVSNVLEVENVDNSTGNIEYDGSVRVNGNVCENFTVKAEGNIEVCGVVEGATLEAGGNISIARGMNGMHKGVLNAGGNVIAKFLENSKVTAKGYVEAESILHSIVVAGSEVHVVGKRGFITGGRVSAPNLISVKNLGSNMGADTIVEVGMDMGVKQNIIALQKEISEIRKSLDVINPVLDGAKKKIAQGIKLNADQLKQIQQLALLSKDKNARIAECNDKLAEYASLDDVEYKGEVVVTGEVYPGTKICIGDVSSMVKTTMKYCRFVKEAGDVKMAAIY